MLNKKSVEDLKDLQGKKVLVRCDFNVPLKEGVIQDENRLVGALPTIKKLMEQGARVILCSHLGKPKGEAKSELSLAPVATRLSELLETEVKFANDNEVVGANAKAIASELKDGEVMLLQNTRYRVEETKYGKDENAVKFAEELASLCENQVFVNDAFGTAHRAHCSNVGVTKVCKENVVGYLMQKEIKFLGESVETPVRPFVAILGGAKVSDKIGVINNLLEKVDTLIIGGGMAYTFLKAQGQEVGNSLLEADKMDYALEMIKKAEERGVRLLLPVDHIIGQSFSNDTEFKTVETIEEGWSGFDIGPKSIALFMDALKDAKTVVWNGPMGVFEFSNFAEGTLKVASVLAELQGATTIIGGGDSVNAVKRLGFADKMTHISTGGGASLEFLEGKELPGVAAADSKGCGCGCTCQ
ncbi:MAG: phosphoglycerate kinase [Cellulosilyticaceae bacterium]